MNVTDYTIIAALAGNGGGGGGGGEIPTVDVKFHVLFDDTPVTDFSNATFEGVFSSTDIDSTQFSQMSPVNGGIFKLICNTSTTITAIYIDANGTPYFWDSGYSAEVISGAAEIIGGEIKISGDCEIQFEVAEDD